MDAPVPIRATTASDQEAGWLHEIANGDRHAFQTLYQAYQPRLFRYIFRCVGKHELSEELLNDVMLAVWKGAKTFLGRSKPSTWIFGIAHHKVMNAVRRFEPETAEIEAETDFVDPRPGPEEDAAYGAIKDKIKQALERLSAPHRSVIELTFYHEFSYQEIAEIMQCPMNTVKTRLFYAKKQLQTILDELGIRGEPS